MRWASQSQFCFSSRRRHTRFDCDWSSDVCSSDLFESAVAYAVARKLGFKKSAVHWVVVPFEQSFRSEEHTSELQSQSNLVCRLLLEKKKKKPSDIVSREMPLPAASRRLHSLCHTP